MVLFWKIAKTYVVVNGCLLFPRPGCLATVVKPYGLGYRCYVSPPFAYAMQMATPGAAINFPLGNRVISQKAWPNVLESKPYSATTH